MNTTISGNVGTNAEGGIDNGFGPIKIVNSTIAGNSAPGPGGFGGGFLTFGGPATVATLTNTTITGNTATFGGGLVSFGPAIRLQSTIVANNRTVAGGISSDGNCNRPMASSGYNLDSGFTCGLHGPGDLSNTDPRLGPLQDNGGPTQTEALLPGSPAIDAVALSVCPPPPADQRGVARPQGAACDMGAFEFVPNKVSLTANPSTLPASGTSTSTITATVTSAGAPVAGDTVNFSLFGTCGTLTLASGTTNAAGVVSATYVSSPTVGFCAMTATEVAKGARASVTIIQTANPPPPPFTTVVTASPPVIAADGVSTSAVTVAVRSALGFAVAGDPVMVTISGASCGSLNPSMLVTNAIGQATATYRAAIVAGPCTITATEADSASSGSTVVSQFTPPNNVFVSAVPASVPANGTSTATVTATVSNTTGVFVSGDSVSFAIAANPPGACGTLSQLTTTTNAAGQAATTYISSITAGFCTITAREGNTGGQGTVTITQTVSGGPGVISVTASPSSVPADAFTTSTVTATVTTATGIPVSGDTVRFTSSGIACGSLTPGTATTGSTGNATTTYIASTTTGPCTVTATEGNSGLSNSTTITQTAPPNVVAVAPGAATVAASGSSTQTFTATVTNFGGFVVAGDSVTFTISGRPGGACGTMNPSAGTTNSSGQVTSVYISSTTSGFCTVTATEANTGGSGSAIVDQTISPAPGNAPFNVAPITFSPPVVPADGATTATASTSVRDATGVGVAGDTVRFTKGPGCFGVLLNGSSSATAVTDSSGAVSVTYTAGLTVAICAITATEAFTGSFALGNETQAPVPNTVTLTANPSNIVANGTSTSVITATVTVAGGVFVVGDLVTFTFNVPVPASCGTLNPPLANNTDASGHVTITYTASTTVGFCTIRATDASGGSGSVTIIQTT
jgi:hypothetical protein